MINIQKTALFFISLLIISLSISPAFFLGEGNRNLFLIAVMSLSPVLIILFNSFQKTDIWVILFLISIILFPMLNQPQSMRWSTVLYSCMFGLSFMAYSRLLIVSRFSPNNFLNIVKFLIFSFTITLLIQQFCVAAGLPIINLSNYDPSQPWKLNSLAAEPSHSARIVALLMYSYLCLKEVIIKRTYNFKIDFTKDKWVWLSFVWTMITMGSGTALLFLPIVLSKFLKFKNVLFLIICLIFVIILLNTFGFTAFNRITELAKATITLDIDNIITADHSASIRIVPFFVVLPMLSLTTFDGWFGYGIDYVGSFLYKYMPNVPEGISGGGLFQLWLEYGFISFVIYIVFTLKVVYMRSNYLSLVFWFLLVFMYGVNNQMVWLCLIFLHTINFFKKNKNGEFYKNS